VAKGRLEGDGRPIPRCALAGFRGRDGHERCPLSSLRVVQEGREGLLLGTSQPWQEHHGALASMSLEGMGPTLVVEGATNTNVFETYVERVLAPTLRKGQVVIMDNLSAHKGERIRELIELRGCELLYLPPYSPDLNPIEEAFSKMKGLLRKAQARSREALLEAIGAAISAVTDQDAHGFFEHCGYRALVQMF
jgi:transposase